MDLRRFTDLVMAVSIGVAVVWFIVPMAHRLVLSFDDPPAGITAETVTRLSDDWEGQP